MALKVKAQEKLQKIGTHAGKYRYVMMPEIYTSLENFGQFDHYDTEDEFEQRHVDIVPLYALSNLAKICGG